MSETSIFISNESISKVSDAVFSGFDIDKILKNILATISEAEYKLTEEERQNYNKYIRVMSDIGWPAYMDGDTNYHRRIIQLYEKELFEEIDKEIYNHYNNDYIDEVLNQIQESKVINNDRFPIFKEAVTLYNFGYYYGCVALLTSQLSGIVKDIESYMVKNNVAYGEDTEKLLSTRYKVSNKKEKGRIIATLLEAAKYNDEEREYLFLIGYLRTKIFSQKLELSELTTHTNRNMLFHGEQISFGSKEQALKLFLCIESLYWAAEVLNIYLFE